MSGVIAWLSKGTSIIGNRFAPENAGIDGSDDRLVGGERGLELLQRLGFVRRIVRTVVAEVFDNGRDAVLLQQFLRILVVRPLAAVTQPAVHHLAGVLVAHTE